MNQHFNISHLNKVFDNRIRLGIMSALMVNEKVSFNDFKQLLDVTDGNLASHLKSLEEAKYIQFTKSFIGRKSNTVYKVTKKGSDAFKKHIEVLEKMIKGL